MVFCTFCGFSNCAKCIKKTKIYPCAPVGGNGERERGPICKLCDRKFMVKKDVDEIKVLFDAAQKSLTHGLARLAEKGQNAQKTMNQEDQKSEYTLKQIDEVKEKAAQTRKEIESMKGELELKKKANMGIL